MNYEQKKIAKNKKTKANKKNASVYLQNEKKGAFCQWIMKKYKVGKLQLNEPEKNILEGLDRIKKIHRSGSLRIYQFISSIQNRNFYLVLKNYGGSMKTESGSLAELKIKNLIKEV
jgi:hypothetical protein